MQWVLLPFRRYFDFQGRSRRREYWMFVLLNVIVATLLVTSLIAGGLPLASLDPTAASGVFGGGIMMVAGLLLAAWSLAVIIPNIAVTVRRFHDRDLSGWWYLAVIVGSMLPLVGFLVSIGFIVVMALPGTPGPNRFGPDPKDPTQAEVFA